MYQNKLLCYKLCYCLGVPEESLKLSFSQIHAIAEDTGYFKDHGCARLYRAYARVYFIVIRHNELYRKARSLWEVAGHRLDSYLSDLSVDINSLFVNSSSIEEFLQIIAGCANNLLAGVYADLLPGIPFEDFVTLLKLKKPSQLEIAQMQFMLRRQPSQYNIYFAAGDVLNVALVDMLHSDVNLLKRVRLVTGNTGFKVADTSVLCTALRNADDTAFLHMDDLKSFDYVIVDKTALNDLDTLKETISEGCSLTLCDNLAECLSCIQPDSTPESTVIVVHCTEDELRSLTDYSDEVTIISTLPIPRNVYRQILRREWQNVYLLSTRNQQNKDGFAD